MGIVAGDESKAARALRAVLDVDPGNADARRRLSELSKLEQDRRARERALFGGRQPQEVEQVAEVADGKGEDVASFDAAPEIALLEEHDSTFTDREASSRLARGLCGENLNFRVGQPAVFVGPRSS